MGYVYVVVGRGRGDLLVKEQIGRDEEVRREGPLETTSCVGFQVHC